MVGEPEGLCTNTLTTLLCYADMPSTTLRKARLLYIMSKLAYFGSHNQTKEIAGLAS